jgi:hypothetical protein
MRELSQRKKFWNQKRICEYIEIANVVFLSHNFKSYKEEFTTRVSRLDDRVIIR